MSEDGKKLSFNQQSFVDGMNQSLDATRIGDREYYLLINGRNRYDAIQPIKNPKQTNLAELGITDAEPHLQGVYGFGKYLVLFSNGRAFIRDVSISEVFTPVADLSLNSTVDYIYAESVPSSTMNFNRVPEENTRNSAMTFTDGVSRSPQCIVVQDGQEQPWIIESNGIARLAKDYTQWSDSDLTAREYVPIGTRMKYINGILYIVNGRDIYRSVTGRPLDFVVNINSTGGKGGEASTTSHSVDFDEVTCIYPLASIDGSFFVSTNKNSYIVTPNFNQMFFAEPTFNNTPLFNTGANNQFSMIDILGDSALIDISAIRSFNAVLQLKNEGRNSPFSQKISSLFKNLTQNVTAAINFDDYGLFAVKTIYGNAILVFDTLTKTFTGLDIYSNVTGEIKQFCEVKVGGIRKLFFITTDNQLFEAYGGVSTATCQLFAGEWCSNDPSLEQKPNDFKVVFTDAKESGSVTVEPFVDRKRISVLTTNITQNVIPAPTTIPPFGTSNVDVVQILTFDLDLVKQGWKVGFWITWGFDATLTHIKCNSAVIPIIQSDEQSASKFVAATNAATL